VKKLYKAAEEAVEALAVCFSMEDILKVVGGRGRWTFSELETSCKLKLYLEVSQQA
jgi:hypothetical protein